MVVMVDEKAGFSRANDIVYSRSFFDSEAIGVMLGQADVEVDLWPTPSARRTTSESATALERASRPDPDPRLPDIEIQDDLGV